MSSTLERQLLIEIETINSRIITLEQEKKALERLLIRSRRENAAQTEVVRSSSSQRILVEQTILNYLLNLNGRSAPTSELYRKAQGVETDLKANTFRSYLHRLKLRDLIRSSGHGRWVIGNP